MRVRERERKRGGETRKGEDREGVRQGGRNGGSR